MNVNMIPKSSRSYINGCTGKRDDLSFQLLLGTSASSASSTDSESPFPLCEDDDDRQLTEATVSFHLEDGSVQKLVVEENLRAIDLCQLLALKFNVAKSHTWTLVEQLPNLAIERSLEDHEEVLQVYNEWGSFGDNKFLFKQDFRKYEFFNSPQFFPLQMVELGPELSCLSESPDTGKLITIRNMLNSCEKLPSVQSYLWYKEEDKPTWRRLLFRIEGGTLYAAASTESKVSPCRDIHLHDVYTPIDNKWNGSPTQFSFCLKPAGFASSILSLVWFCAESEKQRQCWIVALRLTKFGKKLRENYKEVKVKYADTIADSNRQEHTPLKTRVAMDFTGNFGRVVEDPKEAEAIAAAEGMLWKRSLPCCRSSPTSQNASQNQTRPAFEFGVHTVQPWFYSGMSRDEATQLLTKYGTVDGVFLVRESRRNPGSFVLCYVYNRKVHHSQIIPVEEKEQLCYSLDSGRTKFYDLLQLVEFYQLNLGCLPSKLTHFLVHRPREQATK